MLFNSPVFVGFFLTVLLLYRCLGHRAQNWLLLVASYFFYGCWDWRFLSLIWISTTVDFVAAKTLHRSSDPTVRLRWLRVSILANLGLLCAFKYFGFFVIELSSLLGWVGLEVSPPLLAVALPVGISFYTFQTLSYTVDVSRGVQEPEADPLNFALFVCFFPQLVAGPIERARDLLGQIREPRHVDAELVQEGLHDIAIGFVRKVVLADNLAPIVNAAFARPEEAGASVCLLAVYAFAIQIYCDFAGYSLIARGVSRVMGFRLIDNFRQPYLALDPSDFWQRWHISLSSWLRDYLYIPLGGNRGGELATYRNLMLTMLLGGLWHGAGWNFVVWGFIHGLLLVAFRKFHGKPIEGGGLARSAVGRTCLRLILFHVVCLAWVFFRSPDLATSLRFLGALTSLGGAGAYLGFIIKNVLLLGGLSCLLDLVQEWSRDRYPGKRLPWALEGTLLAAMLLAVLIFAPEAPSEFIYFQF